MKFALFFVHLISALVCFLSSCPLFAQTNTLKQEAQNPFFLGVSIHPLGRIIPHSIHVREVELRTPLGVQLEVGWHLNSQKTWNQCRCYPRAGFSLLIFDYQNPKELGQSINFTGFIEPFINFRSNLRTSFRLGAGFSYLTQVYDSITNPYNFF